MEKDLIHFISLSADAVDSLLLYSFMFSELVKANNFSDDSFYYQASKSLHGFIETLYKNSYAMNPDAHFDLFLKESDFSIRNEK